MDDKFKLSEKSKQMLKELVDKPMIMMETIDITEFAPFRKLSFAIAESVDNRIMEKVIEIAREQGFTDLCLINKEFVVEALKREIERRKVNNGN